MKLSEYQVEIDNVTEARWSELLDCFEDANIYQTWSYGSVRWGAKNLSHLILKRDGAVVAIAQMRIVRSKNFRFGIAYLRWGPMCHLRSQELDPRVVQTMATALREEYAEKRGLYLEILPNAFSDSPRAEVIQSAFSRFNHRSGIGGEKYRTFVLDLRPPLEELRKKLDKKWRNQLNAAERNDLRIIEGDGVGEYDIFCSLYAEMRERKQFETMVSTVEFRRIQEHLPTSQRMRTLIGMHKEQPVAGLVCSAIGDSAIYLLGATNKDGMKLKASYLLHWAAIRSLKDREIRYYDLGGIDPVTNPGVHHFKSGFNGVDVSHISPLVACDNRFSAAFVKAGQVVRGGLRRFQLRFAQS
jgi:lipid II:glycine glycyltransferase (peptidoglycan interpeptide bridge formation enzyme)